MKQLKNDCARREVARKGFAVPPAKMQIQTFIWEFAKIRGTLLDDCNRYYKGSFKGLYKG